MNRARSSWHPCPPRRTRYRASSSRRSDGSSSSHSADCSGTGSVSTWANGSSSSSDREPIELDPLAQYELGELLLGHASECRDPEALAAAASRVRQTAARRARRVPVSRYLAARHEHSRCGGALADGSPASASRIRARRAPASSVTGALRGLWDGGLVRTSYGRVRAKGELSVWVEHLVLQCVAPPGHSRRSVLVGRGGDDQTGPYVVVLRPLPSDAVATQRLAELVRLYWLGQRVPLPFFPESARAYLHRLRERRGSPDAPGLGAQGGA